MIVADTQGGRYSPLTTPTGRLLWVDSEKGNDSLARRSFLTVPFATLTAAKAAASAGDTVMVLPGQHVPSQQLAQNGLNWHFLPGAQIVPDLGATSLFNVTTGMSFQVSGYADFSDIGEVDAVLNVSHAGANVSFEAYKIAGNNTGVRVSAGNVVVKADSIFGPLLYSIDVTGAGIVAVTARYVFSFSSTAVRCAGSSAKLDLDTFHLESALGNGIQFGGGTARIRAFEIKGSSDAVRFEADGYLTIDGARLVAGGTSRAFYAYGGLGSAGTGVVRLHNCVLISNHANESINAANGSSKIQFHGMCTANKAKGANVIGPTLSTSPAGFNYASTSTDIT